MSRYEDFGRDGWLEWMLGTQLSRPVMRLWGRSLVANANLDRWEVRVAERGMLNGLRLNSCKVVVEKYGLVNSCQFLDCDLLVEEQGKVTMSYIRGGSTVDLDPHQFGLQGCVIEETAGYRMAS